MPTDAATTEKWKPTAEVGFSGLKATGGRIQQEFDPDLRGVQAYKVYDEMRRNDPVVGGSLRAIKWVLGQVEWTVEAGGDTPADEEVAGFLESCMEDMSGTWDQFIRDALLCLDFGWAYVETVYKVRNGQGGDPPSRYDDGRLGWRKMTLIGHDTLDHWQLDPRGGIHGLWQSGALADGSFQAPTFIPIEKALLFRTDEERNNPEGLSLLRTAYWPWYKKKSIEEVEAIGIERDLTGVLIIHLPEGASLDDYNKALNLIEQFRVDDMSGFVAPTFGPESHQQWRFEIINSPGNKQVNSDVVITRYAREIARNFLTQFLMLGETQTGSWALSRTHFDVFETALLAILGAIRDVINRYAVPALFRVNDFGELTALPKVVHGRIGRVALKAFAESLVPLVQVGVLTPELELEKYIRTELDLPALPEGAERKPPEDTGDGEPKEQREPAGDEDEPALPDPDDDEGWDRLLEESKRRLGGRGKRSAGELFAFARPYNYAGKLAQHQTAFRDEMQRLAAGVREGRLSPGQWRYQSQVAIMRNVTDGYVLGKAEAGRVPPSKVKLAASDRKAISQAVQGQYKYFGEFAKEVQGKVAAGETLTGAVDARARLYGGAVRSAAQEAKLAGDPERRLRWVRHKEDSCTTCLGLDGKVKTAAEWAEGGVLPSSGTKCDGNCGCGLEVIPARKG